MPYTDDPVKDHEQYEAEREKRLEKRPVCGCCDHPIQDDHYYLTDRGMTCPDCLETYYRMEVDIDD